MKSIFPEAALEQHVAVLGKTGSGKSSVLRGIVEGLLDKGKPVCLIDPKGDWWGLKSSADGKHAGYPVVIFGGDHADVPINEHSGQHVAELVATGNRPAVIDLGTWMVGERTRFFIAFAATLFRHTRGMRWLVIDEVHNFAPQGKVLDVDAGKMLHWANRLASEGRGKGLQILAASQRPQKVHKDLLDSCETLVAMRAVHPRARAAIKEWLDGAGDPAHAAEIMGGLANMPRGTGWVWSPEIGFGPQKIAFPMFRTFDSFRPRPEGEAKLKGWAEVDLEEVKAKLAAVVKDAEENDPKTLRAELASLRTENERLRGAQEDITLDPKAIDAAHERGRSIGWNEALDAMQKTADRFVTLSHDVAEQANAFKADLDVRKVSPPKAAPQVPAAATTTPAGAAPGTTLQKAERLILTALAQYPGGRTKVQVAVITGYAVDGGGFKNALGALRTAGRIEGGAERLTITHAGAEALGSYTALPCGAQLLAHWYAQVGRAERKALEALVEVYPKTLSKAQVAARAGYDVNGGGFKNALGRLRTLELVKGRAEMKASSDLFDA